MFYVLSDPEAQPRPHLSDPVNGRVFVDNDNGNIAYFVCDNGFTRIGSNPLSCVDGEWNSAPPFADHYKERNCTI